MFNNKDGVQIQFKYCLEQLQKFCKYFLEYKIIHFICLFDKSNYKIKEIKSDDEIKRICGVEYIDNRFIIAYIDNDGRNEEKFIQFAYSCSCSNKLEGYFISKNDAEIYFKNYLQKMKTDKIKELQDQLEKLKDK